MAVFLSTTTMLHAQSGGGIDLGWHVLSGAGASFASGGAVTLGGSLGQFGPGSSSGGAAALAGGFWNPASSAPLAVTLADFSAVQQGNAVLLTWETNSELNNRGFNLYRGTSDAGPDRQLNETLIPSQSQGNPGGFVYTWEDYADLLPGTTYFYWVEDVDIHGTATRHGPVSVDFVVPTAVAVTGLEARSDRGMSSHGTAMLGALAAAVMALLVARRRRRSNPA
jgi:MYXO-CTERM domain-containing protein